MSAPDGTRAPRDDVDVDVAIVGYGPIGQALAALLGRAGLSLHTPATAGVLP